MQTAQEGVGVKCVVGDVWWVTRPSPLSGSCTRKDVEGHRSKESSIQGSYSPEREKQQEGRGRR